MKGMGTNHREPQSPAQPLNVEAHAIDRMIERGAPDMPRGQAEAILHQGAEAAVLENRIEWPSHLKAENKCIFRLEHTALREPVYPILMRGNLSKGPYRWMVITVYNQEMYNTHFDGGHSMGTLSEIPVKKETRGQPPPNVEARNVCKALGLSMQQIAERLGMKSSQTIYLRMRKGWSVGDAFTIPSGGSPDSPLKEREKAAPAAPKIPTDSEAYLLTRHKDGFLAVEVDWSAPEGEVFKRIAEGVPLADMKMVRRVPLKLKVTL